MELPKKNQATYFPNNPDIYNVTEVFPAEIFERIPELTVVGHTVVNPTKILDQIEMLKSARRIKNDWLSVFASDYIEAQLKK